MDSQRRARVTLRGAVSGDYVVVEERPDGSLVLAPDTANRSSSTARRPTPNVGTLLSGLLASPKSKRMTTEEILEEWGVQLGEDELPGELFVADVDDTPGFIAITSQRFIFVADTGRGLSVVQEQLLSAARNVLLIRRGMRQRLRVTWHGAESLIVTPDRKSLSRLQHYL
ncbi:MAG: hypothetical protein ACXVHB_23775, partial [Solirubrobacteraceae bacterium]